MPGAFRGLLTGSRGSPVPGAVPRLLPGAGAGLSGDWPFMAPRVGEENPRLAKPDGATSLRAVRGRALSGHQPPPRIRPQGPQPRGAAPAPGGRPGSLLALPRTQPARGPGAWGTRRSPGGGGRGAGCPRDGHSPAGPATAAPTGKVPATLGHPGGTGGQWVRGRHWALGTGRGQSRPDPVPRFPRRVAGAAEPVTP